MKRQLTGVGLILVVGVATLSAPTTAHAIPQRRIIFLNGGGGQYTAGGSNDSGLNRSSLVQQHMLESATLPPSPLDATQWTAFMTCVRDAYADYSVEVTDVDPGSVAHIEVVVGGTPESIMAPAAQYGDSPLSSCANGQPVERSIAFVFAEKILADFGVGAEKRLCEYAVLEAGRALTLDHEYVCTSIMTLREDCGDVARGFQNSGNACGEDTLEACRCGNSSQNADAKLKEIVGPYDGVAPTVELTEPAEGATVPLGFQVRASATDETQLVSVELYIDGIFADVDNAGPNYVIDTPANLAPGLHTLEVRAHDNGANVASDTIMVTVEVGCTTAADCGADEVCAAGACLGDFGAPCSNGTDCVTGACAEGPGEVEVCTAVCEGAGGVTCPTGTTCQTSPAGGLDKCFPDGAEGGCGCRTGGRGPTAPLAGLAAALLVCAGMRRKRSIRTSRS